MGASTAIGDNARPMIRYRSRYEAHMKKDAKKKKQDPIPSWPAVSFFGHAAHAARPSRMAEEPPKLPVSRRVRYIRTSYCREKDPRQLGWTGPGGLAPWLPGHLGRLGWLGLWLRGRDRASDPAKVFHDSRPGRLMRRPIAADYWASFTCSIVGRVSAYTVCYSPAR